ncbi:MAG: hypothetical protein WBZ51_05015 [Xanthobacteraceae bacterium]
MQQAWGFVPNGRSSTYSCCPATKLISNYTKHLAETPNDTFMKGAEWSAQGKLKQEA